MKNKELIFLFFTFLFAVFARLYVISDNSISFWFDQSRDAYVSRQIVENGDLKLLGPSASGTNDTVYHGVLYYYIIGPAYSLSGGNPFLPSVVLITIASLAVFPLYLLAKGLFGWKTAVLTVLLYTISSEAIQLSVWLSNPTLAMTPLMFYLLGIWQSFYKLNARYLPLVGLSFGLLFQSALWLVFLAGIGAVGLWYALVVRKADLKRIFPLREFLLAIGLFGLFFAPWVAGQVKLSLAGVFSLGEVSTASQREVVASYGVVENIVGIYIQKFLLSLFPSFSVLSFLVMLLMLWKVLTLQLSKKIFLISWLSAPLWLWTWHARDSIHLLTGFEVFALLVLSYMVIESSKKIFPLKSTQFFLAVFVIVVFLISNIQTIGYYRSVSDNAYIHQSGAVLRDQLALIDYTYELAQGKDFTFSSYTNPIGYNITWAYLYDWHGRKEYGYVPNFVGSSQTGIFGEGLLPENNDPSSLHFSIIEPVAADDVHRTNFIGKQNTYDLLLTEEKEFGTIKLQVRKATSGDLSL